MRIRRPSLVLLSVVAACSPPSGRPEPHAASGPPPLPDPALVEPAVLAALERSREAVVAAPDDVAAWTEYAARLDANGVDAEAAAAWAEVVARAPDDPRPRLHLARMLRALGRDDEALARMVEAEERAPGVASLRVRRGAWLLDTGRIDEAAAAFAEAASLAPTDLGPRIGAARVALERDEVDAARALLDSLVELPGGGGDGADEPYVWFLLAEAARRQGDATAADRARARADPSRRSEWFVDAWEREVRERRSGFDRRKARLLARVGSAPPADLIGPLAAMQAERPDDLGLLAARIEVQLRAGDVEAARRLVDVAHSARPDHARIHLLRARFLEWTGDPRGALSAAERAAVLHPGLGVAHFQVGVLRSELGDRAGAVTALEAAVKLGFEDDRLLLNLGYLQADLGRTVAAADSFLAATRRDPRLVPAWMCLSGLRLQHGDVPGAHQALERAEALAPDDPQVRAMRARLSGEDER